MTISFAAGFSGIRDQEKVVRRLSGFLQSGNIPHAMLFTGSDELSLGEYLAENRYGRLFIHNYIVPMGAAIWSTPAQDMLDYPLQSFVRFCEETHEIAVVAGELDGATESLRRVLDEEFDANMPPVPQHECCAQQRTQYAAEHEAECSTQQGSPPGHQ